MIDLDSPKCLILAPKIGSRSENSIFATIYYSAVWERCGGGHSVLNIGKTAEYCKRSENEIFARRANFLRLHDARQNSASLDLSFHLDFLQFYFFTLKLF